MLKCGKGKGPRAAKVSKAWATRSSTDDTSPQRSGRSEGEDNSSSSVIGREEVNLVVEEVLKTLKQCDIMLLGPNQNASTPTLGTTSKSEATFSRF